MAHIPIYIDDIFPDQPVPFNIYTRSHGRMLLFIRAGARISAPRLKELTDRKDQNFYIDTADLAHFKTYFAEQAKRMARDVPEDALEAGLEDAARSSDVVKESQKEPYPYCSFRGAALFAGIFALVEMYLGVREGGAIFLGAAGAFGFYIALNAWSRNKYLKTTLPPERRALRPIRIKGGYLCPHCRESVDGEAERCESCGGRMKIEAQPEPEQPPAPEKKETPKPATAQPKPAAPAAEKKPAKAPEPAPA